MSDTPRIRRLCPVCDRITYSTRLMFGLRDGEKIVDESDMYVGYCPGHQILFEQGLICLMGYDESQSDNVPSDEGVSTVDMADMHRSGEHLHIERDVFELIFEEAPPPEGFCYVPKDNLEFIKGLGCNQIPDPVPPNLTRSKAHD